MRIGLLTTSFPRFEDDIAGCFVLGFARALVGQGHLVDVLAPEPLESLSIPRWDGISVHWIPYLRPRFLERTFYGAGVPDNLRIDPRAWLGLVPFVAASILAVRKVHQPWDALVSHWALPSALIAGTVRERRPHLAVLHSADVHALSRLPGSSLLARRIAEAATSLLFVSEGLLHRFLALLPPHVRAETKARSHVSPMGIDLPKTTSERQALRRQLGLQRFTVAVLGRLVPIKGVDTVIDALVGQDMILVVAGDGPERQRLEQRARRSGVEAQFLGALGRDQKWEILRAADAFVAPSRTTEHGRTEGSPTAVLEAMAARLPVVTTRARGPSSIVEHERTGLLVTPDRPRELAQALNRLQRDPSLRTRLGDAAHHEAKRYRWRELAPRLEQLLTGERAVSQPAARSETVNPVQAH